MIFNALNTPATHAVGCVFGALGFAGQRRIAHVVCVADTVPAVVIISTFNALGAPGAVGSVCTAATIAWLGEAAVVDRNTALVGDIADIATVVAAAVAGWKRLALAAVAQLIPVAIGIPAARRDTVFAIGTFARCDTVFATATAAAR